MKNVYKSYIPGVNILDDISVATSNGDKIAIVGENGAGKTTLLKILAGQEMPDKGIVSCGSDIIRWYVPQEFYTKPGKTVEQYLNDSPHKATRILSELGLPRSLLRERVENLSGGQKRAIELSRAFSKNTHFIILDEPENHLDYYAREWLANKLLLYQGGILFVSHDQWLIDTVANRIVELEDGKLGFFPEGYQAYLEERLHRLETEYKQWSIRRKEILRHKAMVAEYKQRTKLTDKFSRTYQSKKKKLERLQEEQTEKPRIERPKMKLQTGSVDKKAKKRIISVENLQLCFGNKCILQDVTQDLLFGEKVCLFGRNGTGKSSLFRMIQGEVTPTSGTLKIGENIRVGYFSQEHNEELDMEQTPLQFVQQSLRETEGRARSILHSFLFPKDSVTRKIRTFSGGQKTRLRFTRLFGLNPELLLLDEPTNHLDRTSWEVLVDAIKEFSGTVLFISHDREFIDQTASKLWVVEKDIQPFFGNLSEYLESGLG